MLHSYSKSTQRGHLFQSQICLQWLSGHPTLIKTSSVNWLHRLQCVAHTVDLNTVGHVALYLVRYSPWLQLHFHVRQSKMNQVFLFRLYPSLLWFEVCFLFVHVYFRSWSRLYTLASWAWSSPRTLSTWQRKIRSTAAASPSLETTPMLCGGVWYESVCITLYSGVWVGVVLIAIMIGSPSSLSNGCEALTEFFTIPIRKSLRDFTVLHSFPIFFQRWQWLPLAMETKCHKLGSERPLRLVSLSLPFHSLLCLQ